MSNWKVTLRKDVAIDDGHSYGVDELGRLIPSVTRLVNPSSNMPKFATPAMRRGTRVHEVLEGVVSLRANGEAIRRAFCGTEDIRDDVYKLAMQWQSKAHQPYAKMSAEVSFVCTLSNGSESYSYAGTVDLVETVKNKTVLCADWKTGSSYSWHKQQLACYMFALSCPSGAIIYTDKVQWVDAISADAVVNLIKSFYARQAIDDAKKKARFSQYRDWQVRCNRA